MESEESNADDIVKQEDELDDVKSEESKGESDDIVKQEELDDVKQEESKDDVKKYEKYAESSDDYSDLPQDQESVGRNQDGSLIDYQSAEFQDSEDDVKQAWV